MSVIQKCKDSGIAEIIISSLVRVIIEANESLRNFCRQNGIQLHRQQKYSTYKAV